MNGLDTMIKRLLKKNTEQFVKKFEYYRVALQKEMDSRQKQNRSTIRSNKPPMEQRQHVSNSSHSFSHNYPPPPRANHSVSPNGISHTVRINYPYATPPVNSAHKHIVMDHSKTMPPNIRGDHYNTMSSSNAISNYQQHLNISQQGSTYFNSNSENTTVNIIDAYDGLPETFV